MCFCHLSKPIKSSQSNETRSTRTYCIARRTHTAPKITQCLPWKRWRQWVEEKGSGRDNTGWRKVVGRHHFIRCSPPYLFLWWYTKTTENSFFCYNLANLYCIMCVAKLFLNLDYKVIFGTLHKERKRERKQIWVFGQCVLFCVCLLCISFCDYKLNTQCLRWPIVFWCSTMRSERAHTMRVWAIKNKVFWLSGSSILFAFRK